MSVGIVSRDQVEHEKSEGMNDGIEQCVSGEIHITQRVTMAIRYSEVHLFKLNS